MSRSLVKNSGMVEITTLKILNFLDSNDTSSLIYQKHPLLNLLHLSKNTTYSYQLMESRVYVLETISKGALLSLN